MVYSISEEKNEQSSFSNKLLTTHNKRRTILHIDFNSYFATIEQQANPRLRGKPIGVTGGDRMKRTVIGAASVEAKTFGVKTGMRIDEALKICPELILVKGDSEKYLESTKRFLNILKRYSPYLEVFSIDEVFLEVASQGFVDKVARQIIKVPLGPNSSLSEKKLPGNCRIFSQTTFIDSDFAPSSIPLETAMEIAMDIKRRIGVEVGEWVRCSIGISYNKVMAKLAGSLQKPDGLNVIADEESARFILDRIELDDICGIGHAIKHRLYNMGVFNFRDLRKVPLKALLASFKSYGTTLYNFARGIDHSPIVPFYEKEEVKSVGHRLTMDHDSLDEWEIKQILLKLTELISRKLRAKRLVGRTVSVWYRSAFNLVFFETTGIKFAGEGMQCTILETDSGIEIFKASWETFLKIWDRGEIRMIGASISNLRPKNPENLTFLEDKLREEKILKIIDRVNDRYGEFTLQRGVLVGSRKITRKPNAFLADYRFKI